MIICPVCLQPIRDEDKVVKSMHFTRHSVCPEEPIKSKELARDGRVMTRVQNVTFDSVVLAARLHQLADDLRYGNVSVEEVLPLVRGYLEKSNDGG